MQEPDISVRVRQSRFSDPFSLQSRQLQPDYVSSYLQMFLYRNQNMHRWNAGKHEKLFSIARKLDKKSRVQQFFQKSKLDFI